MKPPRLSEIIAFPGRSAASERFSARDRIAIANLPARLAEVGLMRVDLNTQSDHGDSQFGDFLSFYGSGESWSRWGIGCSGRGFVLWRASDGESIGYYDCLAEAVDALEGQARCSAGPEAAGLAAPQHDSDMPDEPEADGSGPPARHGMGAPA